METPADRVSLQPVLWLCGILLFAHVAVDALLTTQQAILPSGILLLLENALASAACFWRSRRSPGPGRLLWSLIAVAELIHLASGIEVGLEMVFFHFPHNLTTPSDFIIFLWGVPIFLAVGSPTESQTIPVFYWLDGVQVTLIMVAAFVAVFGGLPFQNVDRPVLSGLATVVVYAVENVVIAISIILRVQTRVPVREKRAFFTSIAICLSLYAITGPVYNFLNVLSPAPWIRLQFILALHQLLMVILAVHPVTWPRRSVRAPRHRILALAFDNSSAILYPLCVVLGALVVLPLHMRTGIVIILVSLLCYGARSTILQVRFQQIQTRMAAAQLQLEQMTLTDPLTSVANRRAFSQRLSEALAHPHLAQQPFSVLLIDIDHFKILNDTFGHTEGDRSLCAIAHSLAAALPRPNDLVARLGGEEFAVILTDTPLASALPIAHQMMQAVADLRLPNPTPIGSTVTISIGLTESTQAHSEEEIMRTADTALYQAKRTGRNRAVTA
jgi:diguanylate cyclase (GGDEF)-like protein